MNNAIQKLYFSFYLKFVVFCREENAQMGTNTL